MRSRAWGIGWRVAVALLLPFGWLALILLGPASSIWSKHLRREYLLWRWRRSCRGKPHLALDARRAAPPEDVPSSRPTTVTKPHPAA
jgi:hypothetical protein